jgi:hypothetical protein
MGTYADDEASLRALNDLCIEAFRRGSWELLEPILSPSFTYLNGATGEVWGHERYAEVLRAKTARAVHVDQIVVHVDGDTAVVSARTSRTPGTFGRYVDTYARRAHGWECVHACVWPLVSAESLDASHGGVGSSTVPELAVRRDRLQRMS